MLIELSAVRAQQRAVDGVYSLIVGERLQPFSPFWVLTGAADTGHPDLLPLWTSGHGCRETPDERVSAEELNTAHLLLCFSDAVCRIILQSQHNSLLLERKMDDIPLNVLLAWLI